MATTGRMANELNHVLSELATVRDEARVRAHLASEEAKQRLGDLEVEIQSFERKLSGRGEWIAEQVIATARGLTQAVAELVVPKTEGEPTRARDVMSRDVATCSAADSLQQAAQIMWERDCGSIPVLDARGTVVGVVTDRDACMAACTRGQLLADMSVASAMSKSLHACRPETPLGEVLTLMTTHRIRRVPVVDEQGAVVGIVALADVARLSQAASEKSHEARSLIPSALAGISSSDQPASVPGPSRPGEREAARH